MSGEPAGITQLLKAWGMGDRQALDELTPMVYAELRRMAGKYARNERTGNSLQATALVNEVYLRMVQVDSVNWQDRAHFFAVSATMMRRILVDRAREKGMGKRGGAAVHLNLDDAPEVASSTRDREMIAIDEALDRLAAMDPRKAKVIGGYVVCSHSAGSDNTSSCISSGSRRARRLSGSSTARPSCLAYPLVRPRDPTLSGGGRSAESPA